MQAVYANDCLMPLVSVAVDLAARAIITLCSDEDLCGNNYVLNESSPGGIDTIDALLHRAVANISDTDTVDIIPYDEWMKRLEVMLPEVDYMRAKAMLGKSPRRIGMVKHCNNLTTEALCLPNIVSVNDQYWDQALESSTLV